MHDQSFPKSPETVSFEIGLAEVVFDRELKQQWPALSTPRRHIALVASF